MLVFLSSFMLGTGLILLTFMDVGQNLGRAIYQHTGLAAQAGVPETAWITLLIRCSQDKLCSPWLGAHLHNGMAGWYLYLLIPLVCTPVAYRIFPKKRTIAMKDPGLAQWETKERMQPFLQGNDTPENPFIGFLGYLKSGKNASEFDARELPPLFIPLEDWCQNTLVWGGIRSGKTTAFFQPNVCLAAHLGVSCVVFDVKWPQKNSGFYETIGYWHARKRPVVLLAPFEEHGARVNLMEGIDSFSDALEVADAVFPPPEFQDERGKHYNDKKRFMIAALMWLLVSERGDRASMRDVLDLVQLADDALMTWVETCRDLQAQAIVKGFKDAGATSFAETKNGIITALKVFYNRQVAYATSGSREETIKLEDCFRTPHMVFVAINQKNQMDGSAEVLFRTYKRLMDKAALNVAQEQGGRLRTHLAFFLDELPTIGKLNYLMRSLGSLRTYNISHHLGIQNNAQGKLVFGDVYWDAIRTNVVARVLMFPRGINGDDATTVSETIGMTTGLNVTVGGNRKVNVLEPDHGLNTTASLQAIPLLPFEEFSLFSLGEAVVRMNGQHPIRTQLVPMNLPNVTGSGIEQGRFRRQRPNILYPLYQETVDRCPGGLVAYTARLIQSGALRGKTRAVQPNNGRTVTPATPGTTSVVTPTAQPSSGPHKPAHHPTAQTPASGGTPQSTPSENTGITWRPVDEAFEWLRACMAAFAEVSLLPDGAISVRINKEDPKVPHHVDHVTQLHIGGLVEPNKMRVEAKLTGRVMRDLPAELRNEVMDYQEARCVHLWLRNNAIYVHGTSERAVHEASALASGEAPLSAIEAAVDHGVLRLRKTLSREATGNFGNSMTFPTQRVGDRDYDLIPVLSLQATAEAMRAAREATAELIKQRTGTKSRRARKAEQNQRTLEHVVVEKPDSEADES